jgi:hypothetical protein
VHAHATVDYANVQHEKATLVDLAQDGMAVRFGKKIPPTGKVYFTFKLPQQSSNVRLSGQVIWQDWNGRAGIQFVDVPKASRRLLDEFLSANLPKETQQEQSDLSGENLGSENLAAENHAYENLAGEKITVEMHLDFPKEALPKEASKVSKDAPPQLATVSVAEQTHGSHPRQDAQSAYEAAAAQSAPEKDNRRAQARYACRLGAEVYRTGTPVPNHCCLTDLSSGGCYLEVSLPFPQGASVEIVVRTYEMKLRLRGTVLASHPGYGMGIGFELKSKEEIDSVKKLTDFVIATSSTS